MSTKKDTGIFQLDNGYWGYRYKIKIEGVLKESKRTFDEQGKQFFDFILLQLFDLSDWRQLNYLQMYELIHILTYWNYEKR